MAYYKYKARKADGGRVSGVVEAAGELEAIGIIRQSCAVVDKISETGAAKGFRLSLTEPSRADDRTLALTAARFSIMLRAGIPVGRVVGLIADQTGDRLMKRILTECAADVSAGLPLASCLEKQGGKIPAVFVETVRAGEETGALDVCFERLRAYYEKSDAVRKKVRSALIYPVFLLILAAAVVGIVMVKLVPVMLSLYEGAGESLPLPTRLLMSASGFLAAYWPVIAGAIIAAAVVFGIWSRTQKGSLKLDGIKLKLPVIGKISSMNAASQFAGTLSALLGAGLTVSRAAAAASGAMENRAAAEEILNGITGLEAGNSLGDILRNCRTLPKMLAEMADAGDESGSLEEAMNTAGIFYGNEAAEASDRALKMLEPALTVFLGAFIGFIVIAIYMPMFGMYNGISA